ncbi:hypothetical protein PAESOLCIP111_04741 [Paenibacillus solanacearum]|uniref:Uncharacterized protein n=1 Tax=Paenibacillus solanacearum TaxID=2048548 RepID=A0A916K7T8_9BACL|nr:hypothetical protein [Paenibacillus solanacearum]CAG7644604.1 hypothetical protein PAESOLCIP111_04741 [Paenibacillus solanacearum]
MGYLVWRGMECCATCIYWGGRRKLVPYNKEEVEVQAEQGACNVDGVNGLADTFASACCTFWEKM